MPLVSTVVIVSTVRHRGTIPTILFEIKTKENQRPTIILTVKSIEKQIPNQILRPVAQLVERWTPGSESPGSRRSGARYIKLLTGMARLVGAAAAS